MLVAVVLLVVAGCGDSPGMKITGDQALQTKITAAQQAGTSPALKDLTDFDWDTVYAYFEGYRAADINADIGQTIFEEGSPFLINETLLVFMLDGKPVRAITFLVLRFDVGRHSHDVVVSNGLTLLEPTDTP